MGAHLNEWAGSRGWGCRRGVLDRGGAKGDRAGLELAVGSF